MTFTRQTAGAAALTHAEAHLGLPYVYGLHDCSWLVEDAYAAVGVPLPRTTYQQCSIAKVMLGAGWLPGDLGFIMGSDALGNLPGHVGIFVGEGVISGALQHSFTPKSGGQLVFINEPYTGDVGGCRFDYFSDSQIVAHTRPADLLPAPPPVPAMVPPAKTPPSAAALKLCNLILLANVAEATKAKAGGWALFYWGTDRHFHPQVGGKPTGVPLYANAKSQHSVALSFPEAA